MYFGVLYLNFEMEGNEHAIHKELSAACEKIRKNFKMACKGTYAENLASITCCGLSSKEETLSDHFAKICNFCETSGFGRIYEENSRIDFVDRFLAEPPPKLT